MQSVTFILMYWDKRVIHPEWDELFVFIKDWGKKGRNSNWEHSDLSKNQLRECTAISRGLRKAFRNRISLEGEGIQEQ